MKARDLMTTHRILSIVETDNARSAARLLAEHNVASLPVLDLQGRLRGVVTDRDLCCRLVAEGRSCETLISELMSEPAHSVRPDATLEEIESIMRQFKVRHLPVVDDENRLQGFISLSDLARHCFSSDDEHELVGILEAVSPGTGY
ncbi:MAG TPA: CBS domain-containing protein [Phycisphaerae bacterium]|nr:CBS domain-containing protein [Phycisphaerae bacterium]HDZ43179.1 CBS domain-containing protein [Phycisphaerae bacterium]